MIEIVEMNRRLLNLADTTFTNTTFITFISGKFSPFSSLVILFSILPSNFIIPGNKSSR